MNNLNIEVGDNVNFHKINFNDKSVVVSKSIVDLLDTRSASVKDVSEDAIKVDDVDEWIPISWVKSITWKHFTEAEESRRKEIKERFDLESKKYFYYSNTYDRLFLFAIIAPWVGMLVFGISWIVLMCNGLETLEHVSLYLAIVSLLSVIPSCFSLKFKDNCEKKTNFEIFEVLYNELHVSIEEIKRLHIGFDYIYSFYREKGELKEDE